ncbi:hypothetical protein [endosymbiont GvMRE of Glomus versiforme]|uniref:hypothetical protein n=1 Tax=endosymbiont GvMRE of Glomus versiforme TaxID=2039283 RepID=UPI000EE5BF31|nr:hypothetical protein [endosymbiont GvMRE of Glomus versiforme]RHZ35853.1 hypothetical protein GvMRE_Ic4g16 [endosymbiont GvMRE of Glomus versiforme]
MKSNKQIISQHGKHKPNYYQKNKQKYLLANQKYRTKLKAQREPKTPSLFQQKKQKQLLKLLVNNRSFVPVPLGLKHPIIKNWNADNYWYKQKIDRNNLARGCVRILKDNWNNSAIIWLDIDQPNWTKLAKIFRCGYITSPKKHIRIPIPIKDLQGKKTGTLYYQGQKIGDAKISGEVMLPGNAYYDKNGQFLGYYQYKAWGSFFPLNNLIWENTTEFFAYLKRISGIEYKSISQHFSHAKIIDKMLDYMPFKISFIPSREPPELNNLSKIANY